MCRVVLCCVTLYYIDGLLVGALSIRPKIPGLATLKKPNAESTLFAPLASMFARNLERDGLGRVASVVRIPGTFGRIKLYEDVPNLYPANV